MLSSAPNSDAPTMPPTAPRPPSTPHLPSPHLTSGSRRTPAATILGTTALTVALGLVISLAPATSVAVASVNDKVAAPKVSNKATEPTVLPPHEDSGEVDPAYFAAAAAYQSTQARPGMPMSARHTSVDTDGDGIPDDIDPDDDNDGIIDELDPDANGNGILDADEVTHDPTDDTTATIEKYGFYQAQVSCNALSMPGVVKIRSLFMSTYGGRDLGVVRSCGVGGLSEHKEGRAWDWGMNFYNSTEAAQATKALDWLLATVNGERHARARRVGIMYIIRNRQIWRAYDPTAGWQKYTGPNPHTDHVHFSFTWNGGTGAVSQWTGKVHPIDYGPCEPSKGKLAPAWKAPNPYPCGYKPPTVTPPTTTVPIGTGVTGASFTKVTAGDTLPLMAGRTGIKGWKLRLWNGLPRGGKKALLTGRWMQVRKVPTGTPTPGFYKVVAGDTLPVVSVKADTKGWRIRRRNGWTKSGKVTLQPGQWLQVRKTTTVNVRR